MLFDEEEYKYKMVAPDIDRLLNAFRHGYMNPTVSTEALFKAMEPLFEILKPLAPYKENDEAKTIWLRIPRGTIEDYDSFEYMKEYEMVETYQEYEQMWEQDYPDEYCWYRLVVVQSFNKDNSLRYYGMSLGNFTTVSASLDERISDGLDQWREEAAIKICKLIIPAIKESMRLLLEGMYNDLVEKNLPYKFRTGVIKRADLWAADREYYKSDLDGLTEGTVERFIKLIESGINDKDKIGRIKAFTANDFFNACKIGYMAIGKECKGYSLPELYMHYSDGRDEGLTGKGYGLNEGPGIDIDDPEAWEEWYFHRKQRGGHPWEVVQGGNSTHMSLGVSNDKNTLDFYYRLGKITKNEYEDKLSKAGYYFTIEGIHRAFESVSFYLALHDAGLPVFIRDAEELVASFTGTDYVGIVPHHVIPKYCSNLFPSEYGTVFNFMHVYKEEDSWFDKVIWLPEDVASLHK